MSIHITARLAWHDDGWNGAICRKPERNTYCVGSKSYPGDVIARSRDLDLEQKFAGCGGAKLGSAYVPPCCYSYNAFGSEEAPAGSDPPDFFYGGAARRDWTLAQATVCVWPYDAMYDDNVKSSGRLDNDQRRANVLEFFEPIEQDKSDEAGGSLIFYYANYSNPLSEEEAQRYVLIGVSRITKLGEELRYENVNDYVAERYAGGMVWARNVTSAYPKEGVRLPYHLYRDKPELLTQLALYPERPELCKMGSRHLSDDAAIGLLEQFLSRVKWLIEIGDTSENWSARVSWLAGQIARLWDSRGIYPGLLRVLDAIPATELVPAAKLICERSGQEESHSLVFAALEKKEKNALSAYVPEAELARVSRRWLLLDPGAKQLFREVLPRLALDVETMQRIANEDAAHHGIEADTDAIADNPYLIAEQYVGSDPTDRVPWSLIDRGVLPSPEVGPAFADFEIDDRRRFRALCVDHLRSEPNHTFRFATELLAEIDTRMSRLPEWKQARFHARYFDVDADFLSEALLLQPREPGLTIFLRSVFDDERLLEQTLRDLAGRPDVSLRRPATESDWRGWIFVPDSPLAIKAAADYELAVREQIEVCGRLLLRPLALVTGPAGTGKTTVIEALIRAVRKTEGEGTSLLVIAPTGKATDRIREVFEQRGLRGVATSTVHSLLASRGWLRDNLTFRREGGKREETGTIILDEASMLDLELAAALVRAIDWRHVRRLILVGDAAQLPPIGRGRVFADTVEWMGRDGADGFGRLEINIRQMLGRAQGKGESIVELSKLFRRESDSTIKPSSAEDVSSDGATAAAEEVLIEKLHAGGAIDADLEVVYWDNAPELITLMIAAIEQRLEATGLDERATAKLWREMLRHDPMRFQILTPHRGEQHGVEALNEVLQQRVSAYALDCVGAVDGVTVGDKVIQIRNRTPSRPLYAFNWNTRQTVPVEVFNGEIGVAEVLGLDSEVRNRLKTGFGKRLTRFGVRFVRKENLSVGYGKNVPGLNRRGEKIWRSESVEESLELAYAISVHKAQGSEFSHSFVVIPATEGRPLSPELVYTAVTRAKDHCTLLVQRNVASLLDARRRENAQAARVNSSLFAFRAIAPELAQRRDWYATGKIHEALSGDMVRSKSEVIIANLLHDRDVSFMYEVPLLAADGTMKLPDFTLIQHGERYYWEHLGLLDSPTYRERWEAKRAWYDRWFPGKLIVTEDGPQLSSQAQAIIDGLR